MRRLIILTILAALAAAPSAGARTDASQASQAYQPWLTIPKLGLDLRTGANLNEGPWVYYRDGDTLGIAGHRTTHSHPFLHLPRLVPGDVLFVADQRYVVRRTLTVRASETWVLNFKGVVLSACHPPGSAAYRYVVLAAPQKR